MEKKDTTTEEKTERVVRWMEEGRELSDEELALLMQDKEAMRACRELQHCKNAVARRCDREAPDVEKEWQKFRQKKRALPFTAASTDEACSPHRQTVTTPHRFSWGVVTGVAASFLLLFVYTWWTEQPSHGSGIVAFQAVDSLQQVTLQTSTGNCFALVPDTREETLEAVGTQFSKKDTLQLAYAPKAEATADLQTHLLSTPRGQDFKVTLEDGTIVWMNAESSLEYPSQFVGNKRTVRLQGEAYFKVAKNPERPFVICTDRMQIQVLGTELNVRNYASRDSHVTLINGSVEVCDSHNKENAVLLLPGEDAQWQENDTFTVRNVDTESYVYWREGYFYFDNMPLMDVMQELGRWYNINVVFDNKELMNLHVRYSCVRSETLERAIALLNHMKKIHATLKDNTVYIE